MYALLTVFMCSYGIGLVAMDRSGSPFKRQSSNFSPQQFSISPARPQVTSPRSFQVAISPQQMLESQEESLATSLVRKECDMQPSNLMQLIKYFKAYADRYPKGPVYAAAYARIGDFYREAHALDETSLEKKMVFAGDNLKSAEHAYQRALHHEAARDEARSWAGMQLGYMLIVQSRYKDAQACFERVQDKVSAQWKPKLLNGLGVASYCDNQVEKAKQCWNKVIVLENQKEKARAYYNCALLSKDQGNFDNALKCLEESKKLGHQFKHQTYESLYNAIQESINSLHSQ